MGSCCQYINSNNEFQFNLDQEILKKRKKKLKNKNSFSKFENNLINSYREQLSTNKVLKKNGTLNSNIESTTFNSQIQNNILIYINKLREAPLSFIPIIDKYSQMVQFNNKKKHYYIIINNFHIILNQGQEVFEETKQFLQNVKPVNKLNYFEDLNVNFPYNTNDYDSDNYIESEINRIKNEARIKFSEISVICNKNVLNEEYIVVSNLIDFDNVDKINRNILLNKKFRKIGINLGKINDDKNIYCIYLSFGEENDDEF